MNNQAHEAWLTNIADISIDGLTIEHYIEDYPNYSCACPSFAHGQPCALNI